MLKRSLTILLIAVFALGALVSLHSSTLAQNQVTLKVIIPWSGAEKTLFDPVVAAAEDALGVTIETQTLRTEDLQQLLPTQWNAGTAPGDVIFLTDTALIRRGGQDGNIADITDLIDPNDFVSGSVDPVMVGDTIYAAPYTQKPKPGFFYRKSFFAEHGLSVPQNRAEFLDLLEQIKGIEGVVAPIASGNGVGWPLSDVTEHFLVAFGGPQLHKELANCTAPANSWSVVEAIIRGWLVPMLEAGYFGPPTEFTTAATNWFNGEHALYFQGIFLLGLTDAISQNKEDIGNFPIPGTLGVASSIDWVFASPFSANPDKAEELLQWLVTEGQRVQVQQGAHIATLKDVSLDLYPPAERSIARTVAQAVTLSDLDDAIGGQFQQTFWDQLKLLWAAPGRVDEVVENIRDAWEQACGS